ncbi:MAG: ABC transporter ATP-binding protein [bacterium]|nr:ABC transporter ATP-binding protein [bacterium]
MTTRPVAIRLTTLSRHFGDVKALDSIDLDIYDGEFFSMLGPSGSGKTTCLRLIAGFEQPTSGTIALNGVQVAGVPPYERDVNTVFQDYALFPHMTVADNIAYGLMVKKVNKAERQRRVEEMLEMVRLPGFGGRKPSQLSGGQRQRVALARALINQPKVLLLDEPLGALDLKLRQEMQVELKAIQHRVGITFIFVTHDQEEALTMSDRIAVFNQGKIEQVGTPAELYERPRTRFVAGFVGTSNLLEGAAAQHITGREQAIAIRPEKMRLCDHGTPVPADCYGAHGVIRDVVYLGMTTRYVVALDDETVISVVEQNQDAGAPDNQQGRDRRVTLIWQKAATRALEGA